MRFCRLWNIDLFQISLCVTMRTVVLVVLKHLTALVEVMYGGISIAGSTLKELAL